MKCPKCGYLGFEATDRCRNCGYDFSLSTPLAARDLPLRVTTPESPLADLELRSDDAPLDDGVPEQPLASPAAPSAADPEPPPVEPDPSEDLPLFSPRPAGTPLAVRRAGSDIPKTRRTTRPVRMETPALPLVAEAPRAEETPPPARVTGGAPVTAGLAARMGAAAIDGGILLSIDAVVLVLTLRLADLQLTMADLAVISPVPMAGFFFVLAFLYLVGFTVGGGQTIGKMVCGVRVIGDDGRNVDLTGAVVRAVGSIVAFLSMGLLFIPALLTPDRRAPHDRLAGTRVVEA